MTMRAFLRWLRARPGWPALAAALLIGYWFLPIEGRVMVLTDEGADVWPRIRLEAAPIGPGGVATVSVIDIEPWSFVELMVEGIAAESLGQAVERASTWTWQWSYRVPEAEGYTLVFYHDCHTGCIERGRLTVGVPQAPPTAGAATKLGLVMPNSERDWHGRSGWAVEVTYALRPEEGYWGVDDLAERVARHHAKGLRVLVRVDYDQRQTLPAVDDYVALTEYLSYVRRLARDERLREVYGYIIGADYNTAEAMAGYGGEATSSGIIPSWYARLFNGYGEAPTGQDNVVQVMRSERPTARVLVGPLRPWVAHPGAAGDDAAPWLTYMEDLVTMIGDTALKKAAAGVAGAGPDGFDVQAPGRPDAPELTGLLRSDEPRADLSREAWEGAQAGFRVYEDWQALIDAHPATRGLPIYIVSTNTYDRAAGIPPAQNYPSGWLTTAVDVINREPRVEALVWFLDDFPHSDEWDWFSLTQQPGRLVDAAAEFDALLRGP